MKTDRYQATYTTRKQNRSITLPRSGSFVELKGVQDTYTHVFSSLNKDGKPFSKEMKGGFAVVRKFNRFSESKHETKDNIGRIQAIAVKEMNTDEGLVHIDVRKSAAANRAINGFGESAMYEDGRSYQFSEFYEGVTFDKLPVGELSCIERVKVLLAIVKKLEQAHTLGYVHGDFHPENIMIRNVTNSQQQHEWDIKIIDPDFTRKVGKPTNAYLLNCSWTDPELKNARSNGGSINASYSHDIYSLGVMLLVMSNFFIERKPDDLFGGWLNLLGMQLTRDATIGRPCIEVVRHNIEDYLGLLNLEIKDNQEFELKSTKELLKLYLTDQIFVLSSKPQEKGANDKKKHFNEILAQLSLSTLNQKELTTLIKRTAIVAHHRRQRSRDQLAHCLFGVVTIGVGFFSSRYDANSWKMWGKIKFPMRSSYKQSYLESLAGSGRQIKINDTACTNYDQLRNVVRL